MKFNQLIAKRTTKLMKERGWTQYQLSQRCALPLSTLSHVLNCKSNSLLSETILNICRGFDLSVFDFFNDTIFNPENISDE